MSQLDIVLKDIEDNKAELAELKEELKKTEDPAEIAKLKKRRDILEETIATLKQRALALTPKQGKLSSTDFHY